MAFPLEGAPAHYRFANHTVRHGVFYVGETVSFTINDAGPTGYEVRDFAGEIVSTGPVAGTTVAPAAPVGGWQPGWYRVYLTGAGTDAVFGPSHGATNFIVIRNDPRFPPRPSVGAVDGNHPGNSLMAKGWLGLGTSRLPVGNVYDLEAGIPGPIETLSQALSDAQLTKDWWVQPTHEAWADPHRERPMWANFPQRSWDICGLANTSGGKYLDVLLKSPVWYDGLLTIEVTDDAARADHKKVTVRHDGAIVEVIEIPATSQGAAVTRFETNSSILAGSWDYDSTGTLGTMPETPFPTAARDGVASAVAALYAEGVEYFEGPTNEPPPNRNTAYAMGMFAHAVHLGHPDANAMGPCPVNIANMEPFFAAGGGEYCDAIAIHDYNSNDGGNVLQLRNHIERFLGVLERYGQADKVIWQTEAGAAFTAVYGVHHPARARVKMLHTLVWEQYGVPRERNPYWYDKSHGFWGFPTWWINGDQSVTPDAVLLHVLAEETFGMPFAERIRFGALGDDIFVASRYENPASGDQVVVTTAICHIDDATVTYRVRGQDTVTLVSALGVEETVPVVDERVTLHPVRGVPTYMRLDAGTNVTPVDVLGWGAPALGNATVGATGSTPDGPAPDFVDQRFPIDYGIEGATGMTEAGTVPTSATITLPAERLIDGAVVWCGQAWQWTSTLVEFDIETSDDGTTWTVAATVEKPTPTSFRFGTTWRSVGCERETYWDEQWIFPVRFDEPIYTRFVRVVGRAASYGGEPDFPATDGKGQGATTPTMVLQEVALIYTDTAVRRLIVADPD